MLTDKHIKLFILTELEKKFHYISINHGFISLIKLKDFHTLTW